MVRRLTDREVKCNDTIQMKRSIILEQMKNPDKCLVERISDPRGGPKILVTGIPQVEYQDDLLDSIDGFKIYYKIEKVFLSQRKKTSKIKGF